MAGTALIKGRQGVLETGHVTLLICDHAGIQSVDFSNHEYNYTPLPFMTYTHGLYHNAPAAAVKTLKKTLNWLMRVKNLNLTPTASLNDAARPNQNEPKLDCIKALTKVMRQSGIPFPYLDFVTFTEEEQLERATERLVPEYATGWQSLPDGNLAYADPVVGMSLAEMMRSLQRQQSRRHADFPCHP